MRQVTSKVLVSEDGMYHVFGTREFIGLLRAEGAGRAYDESIFYRNVGQELLLILQPKIVCILRPYFQFLESAFTLRRKHGGRREGM